MLLRVSGCGFDGGIGLTRVSFGKRMIGRYVEHESINIGAKLYAHAAVKLVPNGVCQMVWGMDALQHWCGGKNRGVPRWLRWLMRLLTGSDYLLETGRHQGRLQCRLW